MKKAIIWSIAGVVIVALIVVGSSIYMINPGKVPVENPEQKEETLINEADIDETIKKCEEVVLTKPQDVENGITLAKAYAQKGDIQSARNAIDRLTVLVPTDTRSYDTMIDIYIKNGQAEEAALFVENIAEDIRPKYEEKLIEEENPLYTGFGNRTANLTNNGFVCVSGDNIYYSERLDGKALYKADLNGKNKVKLSDIAARDINVVGDTVYFIDANKYTIYSVKTDGTEEKNVLNAFAQRLMIIGDRMYYVDWNDDYKLYSAKLDGTDNKKELDITAREVTHAGAWIYYVDHLRNEALNCIRIDGEGAAQITEGGSKFINPVGNSVYFSNWQDQGKLYKIDLSTSKEPEALTETKVGYVNVYGDWIYYVDWVNDANIYRKNISDGKVERITKEACESVHISGKYIYYYSTSDGKRLYRVDLDGRNRTLIGK